MLEGGFARALKPRLQPVQLAKALSREMTASRMVGPEAPLVANRYSIYVSPRDFSQFAAFQSNLERELASYLRGFASRHGLKPIAAITVELKQSDHLKMGQLKTEGVMVDAEAGSPFESYQRSRQPSRPEPDTFAGTMEMPAVLPASEERETSLPTVSQPPAVLAGDNGETIPLAKPRTSVGRAIDNDIVLEARSVSRRHAIISWDSTRYLLEDLGSTNGTFISGKQVTRQTLQDGDEISFGGVAFVFRQQRP